MVIFTIKTSPEIFYEISKECVKYSKRSLTLSFFKTFLKKKFIFTEKNQILNSLLVTWDLHVIK